MKLILDHDLCDIEISANDWQQQNLRNRNTTNKKQPITIASKKI